MRVILGITIINCAFRVARARLHQFFPAVFGDAILPMKPVMVDLNLRSPELLGKLRRLLGWLDEVSDSAFEL